MATAAMSEIMILEHGAISVSPPRFLTCAPKWRSQQWHCRYYAESERQKPATNIEIATTRRATHDSSAGIFADIYMAMMKALAM